MGVKPRSEIRRLDGETRRGRNKSETRGEKSSGDTEANRLEDWPHMDGAK